MRPGPGCLRVAGLVQAGGRAGSGVRSGGRRGGVAPPTRGCSRPATPRQASPGHLERMTVAGFEEM